MERWRDELGRLIDGGGGEDEGGVDVQGRESARGESLFWGEVRGEVEKLGSRAVVGVKGQFDSFGKTQPG